MVEVRLSPPERPVAQPKRRSGGGGPRRNTGPHRPVPLPPAPKPPGLFLMVGVPLLVTGGVVGLAAIHHALGDPLGPRWAADLWDMVRSTVSMWLFYGPFTLYVQRKNAAAALDAGDDANPAGGGPLPPGRHSPRATLTAGKEAQDVDRLDGRTDRAPRRRP